MKLASHRRTLLMYTTSYSTTAQAMSWVWRFDGRAFGAAFAFGAGAAFDLALGSNVTATANHLWRQCQSCCTMGPNPTMVENSRDGPELLDAAWNVCMIGAMTTSDDTEVLLINDRLEHSIVQAGGGMGGGA